MRFPLLFRCQRVLKRVSGAYVPKNQHQQQAHNLAAAQMAANYASGFGVNLNLPNGGVGAYPNALSMISDPANLGNRTVYLGNLHPDVRTALFLRVLAG